MNFSANKSAAVTLKKKKTFYKSGSIMAESRRLGSKASIGTLYESPPGLLALKRKLDHRGITLTLGIFEPTNSGSDRHGTGKTSCSLNLRFFSQFLCPIKLNIKVIKNCEVANSPKLRY